MSADVSKKLDVPLIWATIAWTSGTDEIEVRKSRLGDWSLVTRYKKIGGNTGIAWRDINKWDRMKKFRELVEKITEVDDVDPAAIDDALSRIPEYRKIVVQMTREPRTKKPDPALVDELYRELREASGDGPALRAAEGSGGPRECALDGVPPGIQS